MATIFPTHSRPTVPTPESIKWTRAIRADNLGTFGPSAGTLLATRGMNHIVKRFDRTTLPTISGQQFDEPDALDETLKLHVPYPHPLARQVIVGIAYYAHTDPFGDTTYFPPHIKIKLNKLDGTFIDPPDAADEWAIVADTSNGYIPQGGIKRLIRDASGDVAVREFELRWLYCAFPEGSPASHPTGPRRLNYGSKQDEHIVLTVEAKAARIMTITYAEAPRTIVEQ